MSEDVVRTLNGSTFVVCDRRGDIEASHRRGQLERLGSPGVQIV